MLTGFTIKHYLFILSENKPYLTLLENQECLLGDEQSFSSVSHHISIISLLSIFHCKFEVPTGTYHFHFCSSEVLGRRAGCCTPVQTARRPVHWGKCSHRRSGSLAARIPDILQRTPRITAGVRRAVFRRYQL